MKAARWLEICIVCSQQRSSSSFLARGTAAAASTTAASVVPVLTEQELWGVRIASALSTYFGFVITTDRPRGHLVPDAAQHLQVRPSTIPGAGLGVFATETLLKNTVLGTYPGVVIPVQQGLGILVNFPQCQEYIWRFSDNQMIIDPTNDVGELEAFCKGGNPSIPLSEPLFSSILSFWQVPTTLCRINEPPKGRDVNVFTSEDLGKRTITFTLERDVYAGEELYIDYGVNYDRTRYRNPDDV